MLRYLSLFLTIITLTVIVVSVQAQTPRGLDDLVDMRASSGERRLEEWGYSYYKTIKIRDSSIAYWWNSRKRNCIAVTTKDGRFASILDQPERMCDEDRESSSDRHGNLDDLVGMRISSGERNLRDMGYQRRNTVEFGGGSIAYWWKPRGQRCIAVNMRNGKFSSVNNQPDKMCDDDRGSSGGYYGNLNDLIGMRARNGERELEDRGYKFVNSTRGNGRIWANWWNRSRQKCITVVTRDGRYDSITESLPADCDRR